MIRTRFAPSPTGYLHVGGARTALYSWAYARKHGGQFVLRIEDTDRERSTPESVQAILDGMAWLDLDYDEGPFFQTQRTARYQEVLARLLDAGHAYRCYASREELDALRERQRAAGEKPRYDGRWRPEPGKTLPAPPLGVAPVLRFRSPTAGTVAWDDLVKGPIEFDNRELDDLVIARADGMPTYNFSVVVDDMDMRISHVIRGDDHVNNTPRQINLLRALQAPVPRYGHVPMILGQDGERLSKRHGAVSVLQYRDDGFLPEALTNYLARLGWAHGDAEVFSRAQFVEWFDIQDIQRSPARFDADKLRWLNQQYLKAADPERLVMALRERLPEAASAAPAILAAVAELLRDRLTSLNDLPALAGYFFHRPDVPAELAAAHFTPEARAALTGLEVRLCALPDWERGALHAAIKELAAAHGLKMPGVAMPLRVLVCGTTQTPSIDAVLAVLGRDETLARLRRAPDVA